MKTLLTTTALVLAMTVGANAALLAGGPIYLSDGYNGLCWYINLGTASVTPTLQEMYSTSSTTAISTSNSCATNTPVVHGQSCYIQPTSTPVTGISCKVVFSPSKANVRGSLQLWDASGNALSQIELR